LPRQPAGKKRPAREGIAKPRRRRAPAHHDTATIDTSGPHEHVVVPLVKRQEKLAEHVARSILHEISSNAIPPGTILPPEATMCATYDVGRTTVREALRILEVNGLVALKPGLGGGPQVAEPTPSAFGRMWTLHLQAIGARVKHLSETRAAVEIVLAGMAALSEDEAGRARLRRSVSATEAGGDQDAVLDVAYEFHSCVMAMADNPVLRQLGLAMQDMFNARLGHVYPPGGLDEVRRDHLEIATAILDRDPARAEAAMRRHWERTLRYDNVVRAGDLPVEWR